MLKTEDIAKIIEPKLAENNAFVVVLNVSAANDVMLVIDRFEGVPISLCEELTAIIREAFDPEAEDYSLQVESAGIGCDLVVPKQFEKFEGQEIEITEQNGHHFTATLSSSNETGFKASVTKLVKVEGQKKKQSVTEEMNFAYGDVKVKHIIKF